MHKALAFVVFLTACHSSIHYPAGGYDYPKFVTAKDTNFYFFPVRKILSRRDSFYDAFVHYSYQAVEEPNLSLKPMSTDVFRLIYTEPFEHGTIYITLKPTGITVKTARISDEFVNLILDTARLSLLERQHLNLLDRNYPLDERNPNRSVRRQKYLDSMGMVYPQLYDPAYYTALIEKKYTHKYPMYTYTSKMIDITSAEFDSLVNQINASGYWRLPLNIDSNYGANEGGGFRLEASTPEKYNVVFSDGGNGSSRFNKACQKLVRYAKMDSVIQLVDDHKPGQVQPPIVVQDVQLEEVKEPRPKKHKKK